MNMQAIIMAGGEGSRLRPLTCDCPKPMLPLLGKPLMEYAVALLTRNGYTRIGATLGYLPDAIMRHFGTGARWNAQIEWMVERQSMGTAGGVKRAEDRLDDCFIVLSGDGITDFDLQRAMDFHRARGGIATILLKRCPDPSEYGIAITDAEDRIRMFREKPSRSAAFSDRVNTGIYILQREALRYVPADRPYDFGHDLFPRLIEMGFSIYGMDMDGYWCDVGDIEAYLRVHRDALSGKIHLPELAPRTTGAILERGCHVHPTAWIAPECRIETGAHIGAYTAIGANARIGSGARIDNAAILPGAHIGRDVYLAGCAIGTDAQVDGGAMITEGCAIGTNARIGSGAALKNAAKVWPGVAIAADQTIEENAVWRRDASRRRHLEAPAPAQLSRMAETCVHEMQLSSVAIGRCAGSVADAMWHAALSGAMAQGARAIDAGVCALPQLSAIQRMIRADGAMLIEEDGIIPLNRSGVPLSSRELRAIRKMNDRHDFCAPFTAIARPLQRADGMQIGYRAHVAAAYRAQPVHAVPILFCSENAYILGVAQQIADQIGLRARTATELPARQGDEICILLSADGCACTINRMDAAQRQLLIGWIALERGDQKLMLPGDCTRAMDALAARYGAKTEYAQGERAEWYRALCTHSELQLDLQLDGLYCAISALSLWAERGITPVAWLAQMPCVHRCCADVTVPDDLRGSILQRIAEDAPNAELGEGIRIPRDDGWAWLCPDEVTDDLHIVTESPMMETADELCSFYTDALKRMLPARN